MKKLISTLFLCVFFLGSYAQNNTWTKEPSLPFTLFAPASFSIGDHVYVTGGFKGPYTGYPSKILHEVWDYNTITNTWSPKANFPGVPSYGCRAFTMGNNGYLVSGWDSTGSGSGPNTLWQYEPTTDTWSQKANFPGTTRYTTGTFAINGKAYVACGFGPYTNEVYCYDSATNTWSQKANFPGIPRQDISFFVLGGYAYAGMGATTDGAYGYYLLSDFYRYDPVADHWDTLGYFPGDAVSGGTAFTIGGEGYVITGNNQNSVNYGNQVGTSRKVWKYNPTGDAWTFYGLFPDDPSFGGLGVTTGPAGYAGVGAYNFALSTIASYFYRLGPGTAPYSCNVTLNKYQISNAVYNFQTGGNFSPTAQITWDFGDSTTATGTNVIHNYPATGTYHVTVSVVDSGSSCTNSATDSVIITNVNNCSVLVNSSSYGTLFTLSTIVTNGGGPYTYQWSTSSDTSFSSTAPNPNVYIPLNSSANYCVTLTDASGCVATACKNLVDSQTLFTPCQVYLVMYPDFNFPGSYFAIIYTSGLGTLTYHWDFGDGTTSNLEFPTHTYSTPGQYTICVSASDGAGCNFSFCDSSIYAYKYGGGPMRQFGVSQQVLLGVKDLTDAAGINIYPNPATSEITINAGGQVVDNATVYNVLGQVVTSVKSPVLNKINVHGLPVGTYTVEIKVKESISKVKFAIAK